MNTFTQKRNPVLLCSTKKVPRLVLAVLLVVTLVFSSMAFAPDSVYADVEIQNGTPKFEINKPDATKVRFGGKEWVAVGYSSVGITTPSKTITLLAKDGTSFGDSAFEVSGSGNSYSGSTLQGAMNGGYNTIPSNEKALIKGRTLSGGSANHGGGSAYDPDRIAGSGISDAKLWPLSVYEAGLLDSSISKVPEFWWLRSPGVNSFSAAHVILNGDVEASGSNVKTKRAVRPAFNMDLTNILFTSAVSGVGSKSFASIGKNLSGTIPATGPVKFTAISSNLSLSCKDTAPRKVKSGDTVSIKYSGAKTGADKFVSCVITNSKGTVLYYGKLSNAASGKASFKVPPLGSENFTLKLFNEEINGDFFTDFCSKPVSIPLEVNMQAVKAKLTKPSISGITASKQKMTVKLNKVSATQGITKYQIKYREKGKSKWKSKTVKATKNKLVIKKLKKGKRYQVKIRTYRASTGTYSAWSKIKLSKAIK